MELLIRVLQRITPDQLRLDQLIRQVLEEGRESFQNLSKTVVVSTTTTTTAAIDGNISITNTTITKVAADLLTASTTSELLPSVVPTTIAMASLRTQEVAGGSNSESQQPLTTGAVFMVWWKVLMTLLLLGFFVSCLSHFAQYYQMILDQEDSQLLRRRLPKGVRLELSSPTSGKLKLPPPTPSGCDNTNGCTSGGGNSNSNIKEMIIKPKESHQQ